MHVQLVKEYRFESAHRLPRVPPDHRCARLHGHSFRVEVEVAGLVDDALGWLVDYADLDAVVRPIVDGLDHRVLNEIAGLENPTSEHLAAWLWRAVRPSLPMLSSVTVWETADARCVYRGA